MRSSALGYHGLRPINVLDERILLYVNWIKFQVRHILEYVQFWQIPTLCCTEDTHSAFSTIAEYNPNEIRVHNFQKQWTVHFHLYCMDWLGIQY